MTDKRQRELQQLWPDLERGDPKAVHEARKLSRKAGAQLRVAGAPRKVRHAWRDLRRAIASVRDRDAVGEHLVSGLVELGATPGEITGFEEAWQEERAREFASLTLPPLPPAFEVEGNLARRARKRLPSDIDAVREDAQRVLVSDDPDAWHEWRKDLKRLRYTLELVTKPPQSLLDLLQALGRLQDAEVTRHLLHERTWVPRHHEELLRREADAADESKRAAREAWAALDVELENLEV